MTYTFNEVILMKDGSIKAVYDADLAELLRKLNMYDDVVSQKCHCIFCDTVITLENIDGIIPHGNEIVFSCNEPVCRSKLIEELNTK